MFPTGLPAAIQRHYPAKVDVRQYQQDATEQEAQIPPHALAFEYVGGDEVLREVSPKAHQ